MNYRSIKTCYYLLIAPKVAHQLTLILYSTIITRLIWTICIYIWAHFKPSLLGDIEWQRSKMKINKYFIVAFNIVLINAFFVYFWNWITEIFRNAKQETKVSTKGGKFIQKCILGDLILLGIFVACFCLIILLLWNKIKELIKHQ